MNLKMQLIEKIDIIDFGSDEYATRFFQTQAEGFDVTVTVTTVGFNGEAERVTSGPADKVIAFLDYMAYDEVHVELLP